MFVTVAPHTRSVFQSAPSLVRGHRASSDRSRGHRPWRFFAPATTGFPHLTERETPTDRLGLVDEHASGESGDRGDGGHIEDDLAGNDFTRLLTIGREADEKALEATACRFKTISG
jgi:hypothetical protein